MKAYNVRATRPVVHVFTSTVMYVEWRYGSEQQVTYHVALCGGTSREDLVDENVGNLPECKQCQILGAKR